MSTRKLVVTGGYGFVGTHLLIAAAQGGYDLVVLDDLSICDGRYLQQIPHRLVKGDIRDKSVVAQALEGAEAVVHLAAHTSVVDSQQNPAHDCDVNVRGTLNVLQGCVDAGVQRFVLASSNASLGEQSPPVDEERVARLLTPILASSRFGNVLGSRGSVIPVFSKQIRAGGPVTLTDPDMTRFIMTLSQAVQLVVDSVFWAQGGEVFVTKMPVIRIGDLAAVMVEELAPRYELDPANVEIREVGHRPGEKLYEELVNEEEVRRTIELEQHFVVLPALQAVYQDTDHQYAGQAASKVTTAYNSSVQAPMSKDDLRSYLVENGLLDDA